MTLHLVLEWLSLFLFIGLGIYTMWIIKNEKKIYIENAREVHFKLFKLKVPSWWGDVPTGSDDAIMFKRLDTRYDWEAKFSWKKSSSSIDLVTLFKEQIKEREILFDEETSIIYNPSDFRDGELIKSDRFEMVRLEGTATAEKMDRLYYDAFLIREKTTGDFMYAESRSSVLNGLVEGPYFEEVMIRMELA